jgi:hypothetical protein
MPAAIRIFAAAFSAALCTLATVSQALAVDVTITDAKIAGGKLVVTGTTLTGNMNLTLDGSFTGKSTAAKAFNFSLVYLPPDCIVSVGKTGAATTTQAVVANCAARGLNPQGAWKNTTSYVTNDVVTQLGSAWRALKDNKGKSPSAAAIPAIWEKFVQKGDPGPAGAVGSQGIQGLPGTAGTNGTDGTDGIDGADGATGPTGPAGGPLGFATVYNTLPQTLAPGSTTLAPGSAVTFYNHFPLIEGFDHTPGTPGVAILNAGTYLVQFIVSANEPNQFVLFLNDSLVPASIFLSGAGTQNNVGQVLITATAGDILTLCNFSAYPVTLQTGPGPISNVNASLMIQRLQ